MNQHKARRSVSIVAFFLALVFSTTVQAQVPTQDHIRAFRGQTMGTTFMVKIFGAEKVSDDIRFEIDAELRNVNDQMSTYLSRSEISRFNDSDSTDWFDVSRETATVVQFAQTVSAKTDGAFDITVGPIVNAWGFGPGERTGKAPDPSILKEIKQSVGYEKLSVRIDPPSLRKSIGTLKIDLSSIAKGHGVDRIVKLLAKAGAKNVFVEIGGEVRTSGDKIGEPWKVGINIPEKAAVIAHAMGGGSGKDESMATSGDYRNYFESGGKRYSHTIDPRTASPIEHNLASVSVVDDSCMASDAWATALNVLGPTAAMALAEKEDLNVFLITRTLDGFDMMGTGTLAQYAPTIAADAAATAAPIAQSGTGIQPDAGMLPMMMITATVMAIVLIAMAVGVIFGRKSISGSCGGIANKTNEDGSIACSLCSNPADACKELREKIQNDGKA